MAFWSVRLIGSTLVLGGEKRSSFVFESWSHDCHLTSDLFMILRCSVISKLTVIQLYTSCYCVSDLHFVLKGFSKKFLCKVDWFEGVENVSKIVLELKLKITWIKWPQLVWLLCQNQFAFQTFFFTNSIFGHNWKEAKKVVSKKLEKNLNKN